MGPTQKPLLFLAILSIRFSSAVQGGQFEFIGLGTAADGSPTWATGVSADGSVVAGMTLGQGMFRWTADSGFQSIADAGSGFYYSSENNLSADGSTLVFMGSDRTSYLWREGIGIEALAGVNGATSGSVLSVCANGSVAVGDSTVDQRRQATRWVDGGNPQLLSPLSGHETSIAHGASGDGEWVVGLSGTSNSAGDSRRAFLWSPSMGTRDLNALGPMNPDLVAVFAKAISVTGDVVVGQAVSESAYEPFRWTSETGIVGLGNIPGSDFSYATSVSADGSTVVGRAYTESGMKAFIWSQAFGMRTLKSVLLEGGANVADWQPLTAESITADGRTIVGKAINPMGGYEAYVAVVPEPASAVLLVTGAMASVWFAGRNRANGELGMTKKC